MLLYPSRKNMTSFMYPGRKEGLKWSPFCLAWLGSDHPERCGKRSSKAMRKEAAMGGGRTALAFATVAAIALFANCWFFSFSSFVRWPGSEDGAFTTAPDIGARHEIDLSPAAGAGAARSAPATVNSSDPPREIDNSPAPGIGSSSPSVDQQCEGCELPGGNGSSSDPIEEIASPECDISVGKWIPDSSRTPLYTNETCAFIQPSQNCMMNGRPDRGYLDWRWKPDGCELESLDPAKFLDSMRGKKMVFIGDSIARNHMQSLLCALAQVEEPEKIFFDTDDKIMKWGFRSHNFTLGHLWSPFLAQHEFVDEIYHIHLDVPESVWETQLHEYDVAILSSGYWFFRPSVYYSNNTILGCNPRSHLNLPIFEVLPAYRLAHRNMLEFMAANFRGVTVLRTITVDHFEHGSWNTGGLCNRTIPFDQAAGLELPWMSNEMNHIQVEEFERVLREDQSGKKKMAVLNVTWSSFLRPDGHPNTFRVQPPGERPQNDCLHWCLPGPIDTWNQLLFHLLIETRRKSEMGDSKLRQFHKVRGG
ncbi:protein trichome birefringence-like 25 [Selaginella moellendorffii]|nr:protein trichome birefringence-like 25 [Selaginella moellendorffii]|eukprot:XP_002984523.2 protein trichome birefringence-like 25 [Selaginella moellendorffii]